MLAAAAMRSFTSTKPSPAGCDSLASAVASSVVTEGRAYVPSASMSEGGVLGPVVLESAPCVPLPPLFALACASPASGSSAASAAAAAASAAALAKRVPEMSGVGVVRARTAATPAATVARAGPGPCPSSPAMAGSSSPPPPWRWTARRCARAAVCAGSSARIASTSSSAPVKSPPMARACERRRRALCAPGRTANAASASASALLAAPMERYAAALLRSRLTRSVSAGSVSPSPTEASRCASRTSSACPKRERAIACSPWAKATFPAALSSRAPSMVGSTSMGGTSSPGATSSGMSSSAPSPAFGSPSSSAACSAPSSEAPCVSSGSWGPASASSSAARSSSPAFSSGGGGGEVGTRVTLFAIPASRAARLSAGRGFAELSFSPVAAGDATPRALLALSSSCASESSGPAPAPPREVAGLTPSGVAAGDPGWPEMAVAVASRPATASSCFLAAALPGSSANTACASSRASARDPSEACACALRSSALVLRGSIASADVAWATASS
mmetsp:Transcript_24834/g.67507  ORF Transcript_24834/g.67507 Transcript_24834/m.67507 type:complete len:506 (-) Transcript_24834:513-2030(-)